jgi:SAM-dependent methyltransferase
MNRIHHWICSSRHWKRTLANKVFPRVLDGVDLGTNVLEIGPGPGLTTELIRARCERLTCLELDPVFTSPLRQRMQNQNVTVVDGDATNMPFSDREFTGAVSLTMCRFGRWCAGSESVTPQNVRMRARSSMRGCTHNCRQQNSSRQPP